MSELPGKTVQAIIKAHKTRSAHERKEWNQYRAWYLSEHWGAQEEIPTGAGEPSDEDTINLETNYPYAYIDTMIANVCPTNPQSTVSARQEALRPVAVFREALINETFRRNKLHQKFWKLATNSALCGRGILKLSWNFDKGRPEVRNIDPRHFFFDMSVDWEDTRYCIEVTVLTKKKFEKRLKKQGKAGGAYNRAVAEKANYSSYPAWMRDQVRDKSMLNEASKEVHQWVVVYEFFDFENGELSHWLEDVEEPLFRGELPYKFLRNPYSMLVFNDNMVDSGGVSDIKLIKSAYERLNEIDTLELWHAHASTPAMLVNVSLVDSAEELLSALRQVDRAGSMISVNCHHGMPLSELIGQTPVPQISPSFDRMRERCITIIEFVLGIPAYARGKVGVSDVATEVALADTAIRTRNGRRIKAIQDVGSELAEGIVSLYEEFLDDSDELPIRLTGSQEVVQVTRETMKARDTRREERDGPMMFDYEAVPYSPTEDHRLLQLQKLQQYLPLLLQSQGVDQERLITKLLDLLGMSEIRTQDGAAPPQGAPLLPRPPGAEAPPEDTLATGALPAGVEAPLPPAPGGGAGAGFAGAAAGLQAGMEGLG